MQHLGRIIVSAAGLYVAVAMGPAFAQGGPIDPGIYNDVVVNRYAPFRSPNIDLDEVAIADIGTLLEGYDDAELLEVRQRCSVIVGNAELYGEPAVAFCEATFAWVAENRLDAPNTDAELAAMGGG